MTQHSIRGSRTQYSRIRLEELNKRLRSLSEVTTIPDLTIFAAGSYGRLEASEYSDIDVFFLTPKSRTSIADLNTARLRLFGKVIEIADQMGFPKFSNDCEYLVVLHTDDILQNLGGRTDDYENHFTARMLLLLESYCLYGQNSFDEVLEKSIASYFKDYPDHKETFQPLFLLNDIGRFWKTLLLNYENKRAMKRLSPEDPETQSKRTRHKVRNFKLKYSRMTTCFASIAALGSHGAPVTESQVVAMTKLTPQARLESIADRVPSAKTAVGEVLDRYEWFLEMTGHSTAELESHFADKQKRTDMFASANAYGDAMFRLLLAIDDANPNLKLLRNLVI